MLDGCRCIDDVVFAGTRDKSQPIKHGRTVLHDSTAFGTKNMRPRSCVSDENVDGNVYGESATMQRTFQYPVIAFLSYHGC